MKKTGTSVEEGMGSPIALVDTENPRKPKDMVDTEHKGIVCLLPKEQPSSISKVVALCWVVAECLPRMFETLSSILDSSRESS